MGIFLIAFGMAAVIPGFFEIPKSLMGSAALATFLLTANITFTLLSKFFAGVSFGYQRQDIPNAILAISILVQGALSYLSLLAGLGIVGLALSAYLTGIGTMITLWVVVSKKFAPIGLSFNRLRKANWKPLLVYGGSVFFTMLGGQIILNTDNIVIGKIISLKSVTLYAIAFQLLRAFNIVFQRISDVFLPVIVQYYAKSDIGRVRFYFEESCFLSMAGFTGLALVMLSFGDMFIALWVGPDHFVGWTTFYLLIGFFWFQTYIHSFGLLHIAVGKMRPVVKLNIIEALTNIALSIMLAYPLGIRGVALGSFISHVTTNFIFLPRHTAPILDTTPLNIARKILIPVILPAIPVLYAAQLFRGLYFKYPLFSALAGSMLVLGGYFGILSILVGKERREWYMKKLLGKEKIGPII